MYFNILKVRDVQIQEKEDGETTCHKILFADKSAKKGYLDQSPLTKTCFLKKIVHECGMLQNKTRRKKI